MSYKFTVRHNGNRHFGTVDIMGIDILGIDILGIDIVALPHPDQYVTYQSTHIL